MANQGDFIADKAIYVDAAGKVVDANDPAKLTKIADVGARVSDADVQKYGLKKESPKAEKPVEDESEDLESKLKADLVEIAESKGVEVKASMTKADLIEAIESAE